MARPLRLGWPRALYQVTLRGDRQEPVVEDDEDRARGWLCSCRSVQALRRARARVVPDDEPLSPVAGDAARPAGRGHAAPNGVWSQCFNRRHGRVVRVFQGQYKALMIEGESYLLELAKYVVLNPVRVGMVADVADHSWSSHRAMLARSDLFPRASHPDWLETDVVLRHFGATRRRAVAAYVDIVRAGVGLPNVWENLRGQVFLGSDEFIERMTAAFDDGDPKLREVPALQRRPARRLSSTLVQAQLGDITRAERDAAMAAAYATGDPTLRSIADAFGVHEATVSRALRCQSLPAAAE
jgi:putative transposase